MEHAEIGVAYVPLHDLTQKLESLVGRYSVVA